MEDLSALFGPLVVEWARGTGYMQSKAEKSW